MLSLLLTSRPAPRRNPGGFAASVVLHGAVIAGALVATADAHLRAPGAASQLIQPIYTPSRPAPRATPTQPSRRWADPGIPNVIRVPIDVPVGLPPIDPVRALINFDDPTVFRIDAPTRPGTPVVTAPNPSATYTAEQVEVPVVLDPRSPLPRFPQLLRDSGVEGMARMQFVVDTLGRVEPASVKAVSATHPLFAVAVEAVLPRMHFSPARVGDHKVRQLVEMPIQFRLDR